MCPNLHTLHNVSLTPKLLTYISQPPRFTVNGFCLKPHTQYLSNTHFCLFMTYAIPCLSSSFFHSLSLTVFIYTEFPHDTLLSQFISFDLHVQPIAVYSVPPIKSLVGLFCIYFFFRFFVPGDGIWGHKHNTFHCCNE